MLRDRVFSQPRQFLQPRLLGGYAVFENEHMNRTLAALSEEVRAESCARS